MSPARSSDRIRAPAASFVCLLCPHRRLRRSRLQAGRSASPQLSRRVFSNVSTYCCMAPRCRFTASFPIPVPLRRSPAHICCQQHNQPGAEFICKRKVLTQIMPLPQNVSLKRLLNRNALLSTFVQIILGSAYRVLSADFLFKTCCLLQFCLRHVS